MITWPFGCFMLAGFNEGSTDAVVRGDSQMGFPEARAIVSDPVWFVTGSIVVAVSEFQKLSDFYEKTLKNGALRFKMDDPLDKTSWMWRFTAPFTVTALTDKTLTASIHLERIP